MNWHAHVAEYLHYIAHERNASANTVLAYKNDLGQFANFLSQVMPDDATWSDVNEDRLGAYVSGLVAQNYTNSTTARKVAALKSLMHWLVGHGYAAHDASLNLRSPKVEKHMPRVLTEDEIRRLMEATAANPVVRALRDRALLEVIYSAGMRVSEAINLKVSDIEFEKGEVRCAGRGNRTRHAPLHATAVAALHAYLAQGRDTADAVKPTEYVFLNPAGGNLTRQAVWLMTRQYAHAAGIQGDVTPHTLRHSRAAHMLQSGEDVKRVQEWLGHANIATTQLYQPRPARPTDATPEPASEHNALILSPTRAIQSQPQ